MSVIYSVVIPLKDESENIVGLIDEIEEVMNTINQGWELVCVDDGSTDNTIKILNDLFEKKDNLQIISFKKNFGQSSAFDAGFKASKGKFVITLDGDGQNDPKDIPRLIRIIHECDMVCGIRLKRKDNLMKRITSKIANFVRNQVCEDGMKDTGCSLKIYRRECLEKIKMYQGMHRFLPALFKIEGFRVEQVPVNHRERLRGKSKYNFFNRSLNTVADLFAVWWMKKRHLKYSIDKERSRS